MSDRDPARIESDLQATRTRLGANLDELTRRLSPGQMLDEGLSYLRTSQGREFARNLGVQVRDNPMPTALVGLGVGWLALSNALPRTASAPRYRTAVRHDTRRDPERSRMQSELSDRARKAGEAITRNAGETEDAFRDRVSQAQAGVLGLAKRAEETASSFMDRVQQALDQAGDAAGSGMDRMNDWAGSASESVRNAGGEMLDRGREGLSRAGSYASHLADSGSGTGAAMLQNPVLLSALGITAGAVFGALLPATETEQRYVGGAVGQAAQSVRETATGVVEHGVEVARAAVDAGYKAAQDQGLTPGDGGRDKRGDGAGQGSGARH